MAKTPNSSAASPMTGADFLKRKDWRTVADYCADDDVRSATAAALLADATKMANLQAALDDAAGMVEGAALAGNRYTPADLAALTGVGRAFLLRLIADLAMGLLVERRPDKKLPVPPSFERAQAELEDLRFGKLIFGLQEAADAGQMDLDAETEVQATDRNLTSTQCQRFFGRRGNRNPPNYS